MATANLTLYKDGTTSEAFSLVSVEGRVTSYDGAGATPTFPIAMDITKDVKPVGNATNDRMYVNVHRSGAAAAQGAIRTSGAELKISVAKDPTSGAALLAEAEYALCELVSYVTGAAPSTTCVANIAKLCAGQLL